MPLRWGRFFAVLSLIAVPAAVFVNVAFLLDWRGGGSARPLLLSVAILLGSVSQVLNVRDDWRRELSFPMRRSKVQLALALVAIMLLVAWALT